jgi:hypothetical protein
MVGAKNNNTFGIEETWNKTDICDLRYKYIHVKCLCNYKGKYFLPISALKHTTSPGGTSGYLI